MISVAEGIELYCQEMGDGDRWLLTCQEGFQSEDGYLELLAREGFHVVAIQIRGFGRSTHVLEDYDNRWWEIWADDAVTVADRLGISKSAVSMYERGRREPELDLLQAMADLFGVGVSALLGREETVNADPELTEYLSVLRDRPEMRMLFSLTKDARREDVETAVRLIEALRGKK